MITQTCLINECMSRIHKRVSMARSLWSCIKLQNIAEQRIFCSSRIFSHDEIESYLNWIFPAQIFSHRNENLTENSCANAPLHRSLWTWNSVKYCWFSNVYQKPAMAFWRGMVDSFSQISQALIKHCSSSAGKPIRVNYSWGPLQDLIEGDDEKAGIISLTKKMMHHLIWRKVICFRKGIVFWDSFPPQLLGKYINSFWTMSFIGNEGKSKITWYFFPFSFDHDIYF